MLLAVRRQVKKVGYRIMFEPNREETLKRFQKLVDPILNTVQSQGGLNGYSVQINTETTTQADIENKVIRGKIFVVPTRALEIVDLDFVVNNRGNFSVTG
jgi:phage tail sheath protein FI